MPICRFSGQTTHVNQAFGLHRPEAMGVRSYTDLDAWRLANELKLGVYALIQAEAVRRDQDFYRQIRDAAASAPRNIAEGFGRYQPAEFSQYLRVANGSLLETANHLQDGRDRGYFDMQSIEPLLALVRRSSAATTRLLRYLRTARPPVPRS
jgi:four helix bundle protein